jgi:hypothetical protein
MLRHGRIGFNHQSEHILGVSSKSRNSMSLCYLSKEVVVWERLNGVCFCDLEHDWESHIYKTFGTSFARLIMRNFTFLTLMERHQVGVPNHPTVEHHYESP